jgi:cytoskeletal protein CcmA (bactofilin family)
MHPEDTVIHALLGAGTRYEGKLFFDGRVRIDGDFEGEVLSEGLLVIGEGATVKGTVRVATLIVCGGTVEAVIHASELVEIHAAARVRGDIHTPALFIDKGAVFDGSCVMGEVHTLTSTSTDIGADAVADTDAGYRDQPTRN